MNIKNFLAFFFLLTVGTFAEASLPSSVSGSSLASLTQPERQEYNVALQKAMMDPAVQSTREIVRMAFHRAMLKADPDLEALFANMDTRGPEGITEVSNKKKSLGENFDEWLADYPSSITKTLTPEQLHQLQAAHAKALQDPAVCDAERRRERASSTRRL